MEPPINVEYFHASKYGNGTMVAEEFTRIMRAKDNVVEVHHIRDAKLLEPKHLKKVGEASVQR